MKRPATTALLAVIALVLAIWALRSAYLVTMPFAVAFFVAALVQPIQVWVKHRVPPRADWLGTLAAMLAILAVLSGFVGAVVLAMRPVAEKAPAYGDRFGQLWDRFVAWARGNGLPIPADPLPSSQSQEQMWQFFTAGLTSIWTIGAVLILIFFFVLLMLLETGSWAAKLRAAFPRRGVDPAFDSVEVIAVKVRKFLAVRTFISVVSGTVSAIWLAVMGVDFALLWGIEIFALNYIPTIGSIIGMTLPGLFAMVQLGPSMGLVVLLGLTAFDQFLGNYLDPRLQGERLEISPLVVLFSLTFWVWAWGIAGALLAVPMTATIVIICAHIPALQPVALLLSRTADRRKLVTETHAK